jgi:hypothetical protein
MMTIFFSVNGIALIDILLEKAKLSSEYFKENIIKELDLIMCSPKLKPHATRMYRLVDKYMRQPV